jgi:outer membrane protein TolC
MLWQWMAGRRRRLSLAAGCIGLALALTTTARAVDPAPLAPPPPGTADTEVLPIDLPTALRLAEAANPTIAVARQRVEEAYARQIQAEVLWLPNLQWGPAYLRHDGQIQNSAGVVFPTSKSNLFVGGGAALRVDTAEALFAPLVARRLTAAAGAAAQAVSQNVQLDVAFAYLDLLQVHGALAVNADVLARAAEMLRRAEIADRAEASKTKADVKRARTEYALRQQERISLQGQAGVASARLARLLLLRPTVTLVPTDPVIVPVTLIPDNGSLDELVAQALRNRPELSSNRAVAAAALARWRQARISPFIPRLEVTYFAGTFGGGQDSFMGTFQGRGDGLAQAVWELHNLGIGDRALVRERRAQYGVANLQVVEIEARVAEEVVAAVRLAQARWQSLTSAQTAVSEAIQMWDVLEKLQFGVLGPKKEYESLEPLLAIQALAQARNQYLTEVIEYNRAQFQLYVALGQPPLEALPQAVPHPVQVPVNPPPFQPRPLKP